MIFNIASDWQFVFIVSLENQLQSQIGLFSYLTISMVKIDFDKKINQLMFTRYIWEMNFVRKFILNN